jgi:DNA polymerase
MGIPVWVSRELVVDEFVTDPEKDNEASPCADSASDILHALDEETSSVPPAFKHKVSDETNAATVAFKTPDCSTLDWQSLQKTVASCQLCDLHKSRTQTVFGHGNLQANWMVVGEAPGAEEDRQGLPFVGRAGQLLTNMLLAIGLTREEVYITNVLKCRPPNNRDPKPEEAMACSAYLQRQFELIEPEIILVVGRVAAQNLLKTREPLARLRGRVHRLPDRDIPVVVTYHPAYLLRKPADKRKAWEDLKRAYALMDKKMNKT